MPPMLLRHTSRQHSWSRRLLPRPGVAVGNEARRAPAAAGASAANARPAVRVRSGRADGLPSRELGRKAAGIEPAVARVRSRSRRGARRGVPRPSAAPTPSSLGCAPVASPDAAGIPPPWRLRCCRRRLNSAAWRVAAAPLAAPVASALTRCAGSASGCVRPVLSRRAAILSCVNDGC